MGHNAHLIANVILDKMTNRLTPLQVNKLIYFSHGWFLGLHDKALISENIEAWKYGPVIPSIYYMFRSNGADPISFKDYFDEDYTGLDDRESDIVEQTIEGYGNLPGSTLIMLTHQTGSPWEKCFDGSRNKVIPEEMIKEYFKNESNKDDGAE